MVRPQTQLAGAERETREGGGRGIGGAGEWVARTFKGDQVLFGASPEAREDYEARAAASAPGADRERSS